MLFSRVAVPSGMKESYLGFPLLHEELMEDFTYFPYSGIQAIALAYSISAVSVADYCAVLWGVAGEVSYNTILS